MSNKFDNLCMSDIYFEDTYYITGAIDFNDFNNQTICNSQA